MTQMTMTDDDDDNGDDDDDDDDDDDNLYITSFQLIPEKDFFKGTKVVISSDIQFKEWHLLNSQRYPLSTHLIQKPQLKKLKFSE